MRTPLFPRFALLTAALAASFLCGCAEEPQPAPPPAPPGPAQLFIVSAEPGQSTTLDDPIFGNNIRVVVDSSFTSAKGEECRRGTLTTQERENEVVVFCRRGGAEWSMAPRIWGDSI
ncbi:MAG: hypothetical protein LBR31_07215 [Desulfovibrio sp.]|jgi:hypothetical protein|nr:hypothetical protein [Desulfovibrio sp.]